MTRSSLILVAALVPGCFLADPINQRPAIEIENPSAAEVHRGDTMNLVARSNDPEGHYVRYRWRVQACTDAANPGESCDLEPFAFSNIDKFSFVVPVRRAAATAAVESLRVVLEAEDELGATARPVQELLVPVVNAPPSIDLDKVSRYTYVVGTPVQIYARIGDADDGTAGIVDVQWEVFSPSVGAAYTLDDLVVVEDPPDPVRDHLGKTLTAEVAGEWMVRVTATDLAGDSTSETISIPVGPDTPPCLAQLAPMVPPDGIALPLFAPTLFRVPVVIDDLDGYPAVPSDPVLGVTTFRWSIRAPGQTTYAELSGATGNSHALDPASFAPGDLVDLRVEIFDHEPETIQCPAGDATCSVTSTSCLQRQTWHVEVR